MHARAVPTAAIARAIAALGCARERSQDHRARAGGPLALSAAAAITAAQP
jgi:hypothetical protein